KIALVVFLRAPEGGSGHDLSRQAPGVTAGPLKLLLGRARYLLLLRRVKEDCRAILSSHVRSLAVDLGRIVDAPEDVEQSFVADHSGIVGDLYNFRMPSLVGADVAVGRVLQVSAHVTHGRVNHALKLTEGVFRSPEASCSECSGFNHSSFPF